MAGDVRVRIKSNNTQENYSAAPNSRVQVFFVIIKTNGCFYKFKIIFVTSKENCETNTGLYDIVKRIRFENETCNNVR